MTRKVPTGSREAAKNIREGERNRHGPATFSSGERKSGAACGLGVVSSRAPPGVIDSCGREELSLAAVATARRSVPDPGGNTNLHERGSTGRDQNRPT